MVACTLSCITRLLRLADKGSPPSPARTFKFNPRSLGSKMAGCDTFGRFGHHFGRFGHLFVVESVENFPHHRERNGKYIYPPSPLQSDLTVPQVRGCVRNTRDSGGSVR